MIVMDNPAAEIETMSKSEATGWKAVSRQPFYFGTDEEPLFGWLHSPKSQARNRLGLVICPPIGHEYVHSHRSLRHLADHAAAAGFYVIRFDYHGSGDSGGLNEDSDRVAAWLESIRQAIAALKELSGCDEVGLIGLRMGATFAGMIASEIPVNSLVLWEPCERGRRFVRELKALHLTASANEGHEQQSSDEIEAAGFVITKQTAEDLGKLNLLEIVPRTKNILLCERDDAVDDFNLRDKWTEQGLSVDYQRVGGYADMMAETHFTIVPVDAIKEIVNWLLEQNPGREEKHSSQIDGLNLKRLIKLPFKKYTQDDSKQENKKFEELIVQFGEGEKLFGVLSRPETDDWKQYPTIILSNSGSVHHIGPHRLYVSLSRQFAQMGFRCLRIDFAGLGDSFIDDVNTENHPYTKTATGDTAAAIDVLKKDYPESEFLLMGLCSGAYASFHAAIDIQSENITECVLINPLTFYWKEGMSLAIPSEAHYRQWNDYMVSMRKWDRWLKLLKGGVDIKEIIRTVVERIVLIFSVKFKSIRKKYSKSRSSSSNQRDLSEDLGRIVDQDRKITFIFSETDPGHNLLMTNAKKMVTRLQKRKNLSIDFINGADHTFSRNAARAKLMTLVGKYMKLRFK